jgi:hypothetical protein
LRLKTTGPDPKIYKSGVQVGVLYGGKGDVGKRENGGGRFGWWGYRYGGMEVWRCGGVEVWRYGRKEVWRYGIREVWSFGSFGKAKEMEAEIER